jgi:hypothetical protein
MPRLWFAPEAVSSRGREAVEFAAAAGLKLDEGQAFVLEHALGVQEDGRWAAFGVGLVEPRQNGKGAILEARELAGLFLFGERLLIHSAHMVDTSLEHFRRLLFLIEDTPELDQKVAKVRNTNGQEEIQLKTGERIRFRTRSKGGGRGFSCDFLALDEAMFLPEFAYGALLPTLSARPNPQVWHTGSAVDQLVHADGVVLARIRERGIAGDDQGLAYFEWSLGDESPAEISEETTRDVEAWAVANPGLGIRISAEHVENERRSMDERTFAVERLGVGDWPDTADMRRAISLEQWLGLIDADSQIVGDVCFAFDVSPDRAWASITAAGLRADGRVHVELVDRRRGTSWVVDRLVVLRERHDGLGIVCDAAGPATSLLHELLARDLEVEATSAKDHANACGLLYDLVDDGRIRHLGQPELVSALRGATTRPLGDSWAWARRSSGTDITSLVAATLAVWGSATVANAESFAMSW